MPPRDLVTSLLALTLSAAGDVTGRAIITRTAEFPIRAELLVIPVGSTVQFPELRPNLPQRIFALDWGGKTVAAGIAEGKLDLIFETFTQADGSMTRRYGGAGLDPAIVKQLVELLSGNVSVQSRAGEGSKFGVTLRLPLDIAGEEVARETESIKEAKIC